MRTAKNWLAIDEAVSFARVNGHLPLRDFARIFSVRSRVDWCIARRALRVTEYLQPFGFALRFEGQSVVGFEAQGITEALTGVLAEARARLGQSGSVRLAAGATDDELRPEAIAAGLGLSWRDLDADAQEAVEAMTTLLEAISNAVDLVPLVGDRALKAAVRVSDVEQGARLVAAIRTAVASTQPASIHVADSQYDDDDDEESLYDARAVTRDERREQRPRPLEPAEARRQLRAYHEEKRRRSLPKAAAA